MKKSRFVTRSNDPQLSSRLLPAALACLILGVPPALGSGGPGAPTTEESLAATDRGVEASTSPSFDCERAQGEVEELVCQDTELAALDRRLAELYERAIQSWPTQELQLLRATQRGWIKGRNDCWKAESTQDCVAFAYRSRIAELQIQTGELEAADPVLYVCQDDATRPFYAAFYNQTDPASVVLTYGDDQAVLFRARAASGAKYTGPNVEFWEHHGEATVDWFGQQLRCRTRLKSSIEKEDSPASAT